MQKIDPKLAEVPETMLWTLHNRASESMRDDGVIKDPDAEWIYKSLDYDYERFFGPAEPSHAIRSLMFDDHIKDFIYRNPDAVIVNLGEGLETQRFRIRTENVIWFSVDLPSAIAIRERFITPDDSHRHLAFSALDENWISQIPADRPVFITAQGLFMYFTEADVMRLFRAIGSRLPGAVMLFDTIPEFLSQRTVKGGWQKTRFYTTPRMPWGINRNQIKSTIASWSERIAAVEVINWYRFPRGVPGVLFDLLQKMPLIGRYTPAVVRVQYYPPALS
jgi:O-methyltransferase involved in polyketide biosynthesis